MIKFITQIKGNNKVTYNVYYKSGRKRTFAEKDTVPDSVVIFLVNSENSETRVTATGTVTIFR